MYSLVSSPVLGFDLVRLRGGARVADVLLGALALEPPDLAVLAAAATPGAPRDAAWLDVSEAERARASLPDVALLSRLAESSSEALTSLGLLELAPIGTLSGLLTLLRNDVFALTWRHSLDHSVAVQDNVAAVAASVVCDAAAACYLEDLLSEDTRRRLVGPWLHALRQLPARTADLGPQAPRMTALITRCARLDGVDLLRLRNASGRSRAGGTWSQSVHSASWAVFLCGRVREAGAGQLALVQALRSSGLSSADAATGSWNLLSGALQAMSVCDALDDETAHLLIAPVVEALGPEGLQGSTGGPTRR